MIIKVSKDSSVLDLLMENFPESNKTRLKKAIRMGCVSLQGAVLKHPEFLLKKGDNIEFRKYSAKEQHKEKAPFRIFYEDNEILVVIKPAGVLSMGRTTEKTHSMYAMVLKYVDRQSSGAQRAYTVHRLDREVSGLILFAKTEQAQTWLKENWGDFDKFYYALVEGIPLKDKGMISSWLKEDHRQKMYSVPKEDEETKWAVTHYNVLEKFEDYSLLRLKLETGRKNQLRVHLSEMGHPIIGDRKYGADASIKRQIRLFAYYISFIHPRTGKRIKLEAPLPKYFLELPPHHEHYK